MKYYLFCYDMLYHHTYFKYIILFLCFQKKFKQDEWSNIIRRSLKVQIFWEVVVHWNHYLCSGALRHWLATISPLTVLGTSSHFLCSWSYPFLSFFFEMMTTLWSCLDGGVCVSLQQTNTKTNTLEQNTCVSLVLVGTNTPKKTNTSKRW
jgi:hypothetical protein